MSELAEYYAWFTIYKGRFKKRQKVYDKEIRNNKKNGNDVLNSSISFENKEKKVSQLLILREELIRYSNNEKKLIDYNYIISMLLLNKVNNIMDYNNLQKAHITCSKEVTLLRQPSPIQNSERRQYSDLDFDAYSHYTAPMGKYLSYLNK